MFNNKTIIGDIYEKGVISDYTKDFVFANFDRIEWLSGNGT